MPPRIVSLPIFRSLRCVLKQAAPRSIFKYFILRADLKQNTSKMHILVEMGALYFCFIVVSGNKRL